ncbi:hypothetical protein OG357_36205 [Streptomyces sp. NBC_01255]|uniref:hypothetical protein n=1 Tax=Streptomyces sp. NBC_01255 TaxID=2903798 RepID=UPI002E33A6F2|nr:hypothetical protein [Streptomyces sp. NBC_01255]
MSERESLQAPLSLLDSYALEDVEALKSQGVLVGDEEHVGFFHETYFDYLFARSFLTTGRDVHDFLADSGQHLFRRAQTRQILEHLAGTDRDRFRETTARLLGSTRIRSHLHDVITIVLAQLDATLPDWLAIEAFAWGTSPVARNRAGGPRHRLHDQPVGAGARTARSRVFIHGWHVLAQLRSPR